MFIYSEQVFIMSWKFYVDIDVDFCVIIAAFSGSLLASHQIKILQVIHMVNRYIHVLSS